MKDLQEIYYNNIFWLKATRLQDDKYYLDRKENRIVNRVSDNQHVAHIETNYYVVIRPTTSDDYILRLIKKNSNSKEYNLQPILEATVNIEDLKYVLKNYFFKVGYMLHTLDVFPNASDAPKRSKEDIVDRAYSDLHDWLFKRRQE